LQSNARKTIIVLGVSAAIFLIDWFYLTYITNHGLERKFQEVILSNLTFSVPLQWLPVAGVVLVSVVVMQEVLAAIFPRRTGSNVDTSLSNIRLVRVIVFSLAAFACVLYLPYILGSDWFWARVSGASGTSQIRDLALWLLKTEQPMVEMDPLWQYSTSELLALISMVFVAVMFGRSPKRIRR
jgi:hypothetical protein